MYKEPTNAELFQAFVLGYDLKEQQRAEICDKISGLTNIPAEALMKLDTPTAQLANWLEKQNGYPETPDGGEPIEFATQDTRPTREQFRDWLNERTAFDPRKDKDGWTPLL